MDKKINKAIPWIDIAKGIGIILVVIGHVVDKGDRYIFWFHIPLFFYISGCLYNSNSSIGSYIKRKAVHLLIPYFSFLFILSIPDYIVCYNFASSGTGTIISNSIVLTKKLLYGGRGLYGWFDVFWFMTCLFITQTLFHVLHKITGKKFYLLLIVGICLYVFATFQAYLTHFSLPLVWSINLVPMAIVFFFSGYAINKINLFHRGSIISAFVVLVVAIFLDINGFINHRLDMKWELYGIPILNIIIALSGIIVVCNVAKMISTIKYFSKVFIELGKASMIIMFLHQAVRQLVFTRLPSVHNEAIIIGTTMVICYIAYYLLSIHPFQRLLFPGEKKKGKMYN